MDLCTLICQPRPCSECTHYRHCAGKCHHGRGPDPQVTSLTNTPLEHQPGGPVLPLSFHPSPRQENKHGQRNWVTSCYLQLSTASGKAMASMDRGPIPAQHPLTAHCQLLPQESSRTQSMFFGPNSRERPTITYKALPQSDRSLMIRRHCEESLCTEVLGDG